MRRSGPHWGRIGAFDQRRDERNDQARSIDPKLRDILCDLVTATRPGSVRVPRY